MIRKVIASVILALLYGLSQGEEVASQEVELNIDAPLLARALIQLSEQTGLQLIFPAVDHVADLPARPLAGTYSPRAALRQLLKGSGLEYEFIDARTVAIRSPKPIAAVSYHDAAPLRQAQSASSSSSSSSSASSSSEAKMSPKASEEGRLEEVIVTAQKRAENLQQVPVSANVIGGQTLVQQNLNSLGTLSQIVPDVHISFHPRSGDLYIRGIGSGENQDFEQSVGTFIDDVYHGRARTTAATFLDLDRVEILKGPQSTFFGNNAIAGALNIVTRKPGDTFDASARALYGKFGQYAVEGAVGGPIGGDFAVRVAATFNGMDGWLKNVNTGQYQPHEDNRAARVTLLYKPNEDLDATFKVEGSKSQRDDGIEFGQIVRCPPPAPFVATGFCSAGLGLGVPTGIDNNRNATKAGGGAWLSTADAALTVNYRRWDHTFTSVTGFYNYHFTDNLDGDGTPVPLLTSQAPEHYHQFSQELRVTSPADQPIEYLGGLYFQTDYLYFQQDLSYFFLSPILSGVPPLAPLVPYFPLDQRTSLSQNEHTYAAFGSVSWNVTDRLKLTGGLRGTWAKKNYDWHNFFGTATQTYGGIVPLPDALQPLAGAIGIGTPGTLSGSRSDHAWLPSAKAQYQIDPQAMVYFSYSRGFKAGGFNGADQSAVAANLPFAPEHVNAYEVGLKSQWFDDTVLLNLAVFRADYTNLQVAVNINTGGNIRSLVQNAATSRSQGAELEAQWAVTRNFRLSANASYDDAHYVRYPNVTPTQLQILNSQAVQDLSGRPTYFAPRWSGSLSGSYRAQLPADYHLTGELTTFATSSYFLDGTDDPTVSQDAFVRFDARLSLESPGGRWTLDLIGKNLSNRNILSFGQAMPLSLGSVAVQKEQPRSVAAQVRFHW
jgi:iron complex outermembrane receptor protein